MKVNTKIFTCKLCCFKTRTFFTLTNHYTYVHSSDPGFRIACKIDGCPRSYKSVKYLYRHIRAHHAVFYNYHLNRLRGKFQVCDNSEISTSMQNEVGDDSVEMLSDEGNECASSHSNISWTHETVKRSLALKEEKLFPSVVIKDCSVHLQDLSALQHNETINKVITSEMIRLHVTVSSYKKILSLTPEFATLAGLTKLIREKFPYASLPKDILIQYWFEEEDFSEWVDVDEDTIQTFEDQKIHKLKVVALDEPYASAISTSPRSATSHKPQADDVHPTASTSHSSLTVPASSPAPSESGSKPGGKDHAIAFPVTYRIPIQQLPHGLKKKQEKGMPLNQEDVRLLLTCIYKHVTAHYENSFYPTPKHYKSMANAVLTSFPAILRNSDLEEHELKLQWKLRIQRKFQNSRKRQDSFVKEVAARKKKKAPHVEAEETEHPPKPHSENVDSVKIYRQWLALEWLKRDPDLDKVEDLMQLTLSERRNQITNGDISVPEIINLYPWIQSFDGIINEFLRLELHTDEPDPRIAILQGLEKYKLPVTSLLKKRRAVPHYMKTLLELYEHNESEYDCLVTLGLLHLLGERKDSIFIQVPEGELRTRQSSISIQHVGDIHESDRFCILFDGVPVAEPACIAMAVASFVAGHFVFHIDHPKNCEHFLSFASSYLLGIKDGRETTSKSRTLVVKLNEEQTKFSYSNT